MSKDILDLMMANALQNQEEEDSKPKSDLLDRMMRVTPASTEIKESETKVSPLDKMLASQQEERYSLASAMKEVEGAPNGALSTFGHQVVSKIIPATVGALGATGATVLAAPTGPGAIVANVATSIGAEAGATKIQESILEALQGSEARIEAHKQEQIDVAAHPFASSMGALVGEFPMMLSGTKIAQIFGKKALEKAGQEITKESLEIASGKAIPQIIGGATGFAGMGGGAAASEKVKGTPGSEDLSILNETARGAVQGLALGAAGVPLNALGRALGKSDLISALTPVAKGVLAGLGKSVPDAVVVSLADEMYNSVVEDQPFSFERAGLGSVEQIPAFVVMNVVTGVLGAKAKFGSKEYLDLSGQERAKLEADFNIIPDESTLEIVKDKDGKDIILPPKEMYQPKAGVELTRDHLRLMFENNLDLNSYESTILSHIHEAAAQKLGITSGEMVKKYGLGFGVLPERPVGHEFTFINSDLSKPNASMVKNADGTWTVKIFEKLGDEKPLSEKIIQEKDLMTEAAKLTRKGMKSENYQYSMGEEAIKALKASKDSLTRFYGESLEKKQNLAKQIWESEYGKFSSRSEKDLTSEELAQVAKGGIADTKELEALNRRIKAQTGFYKDVDGKWKYVNLEDDVTFRDGQLEELVQIPESEWKTSDKQMKLEDLADVESIKEAYPDLYKKTLVVFKDMPERVGGSYDKQNNIIYINRDVFKGRKGIPGEIADTIRHELQHGIQEKEGFAKGANTLTTPKDFNVQYEKYKKQYSKEYAKEPQETIEAWARRAAYDSALGEMESRQAMRGERMSFEVRDPSYIPTQVEASNLGINSWDAGVKFNKDKIAGVTFYPTGEKLIQAFKGSNFSAIVHEYGHVFLKVIGKEEFKTIADWAQTSKISSGRIEGILNKNLIGDPLTTSERAIYRKVHEKFAGSFEEYIRQGKAPSARLKLLFDYAANIIKGIYRDFRKAPNSQLDESITKVFDKIFLGDKEKFDSEIYIPSRRIKSQNGKLVTVPPVSYKIFNNKGVASIEIPGEAGKTLIVDVENIIKGEPLSQEQILALGKNAQWISKFDSLKIEQLQFRDFRNINITRTQLENMPEKKLYTQARKMGFDPSLYDRKTTEDLVWGKLVSDAQASLRDASQEDLNKSIQYKIERLPNNLFYNWSAWVIDRVRDIPGGSLLVPFHYEKGTRAIASTHSVIGLQAKRTLDLQREVRWGGEGVRELNKGVRGKYIFIANVASELDAKYFRFRPKTLGDKAQAIVNKLQSFLDMQADIAESEGMSIRIKSSTGEETYLPFHGGRESFPRLYTQEFWAILTDRDPSLRKQLALGLMEANPGMTFETSQKLISSMSEHTIKNKRIYMEAQREIPVMPTHLVGLRGELIPLLETDIFNYASKLQHKLAMRVGFFREYATPIPDKVDTTTGQVIKSTTKVVDQELMEKYVKDFEKDTGYGLELERLFNALNGVPLTDKYTISPSSPAYPYLKAVENYLMIKRAFWMTKSMWVNIVEPTIKTPAIVGWRNYGETIKDFAPALIAHSVYKVGGAFNKLLGKLNIRQFEFLSDLERHDSWNLMKQEMINAGTMSEHLARFTIDPNDAYRSGSQAIASIVSKIHGTTGAISFGEYFSSWAGHLMSDKLRAGLGDQNDVARLRQIGYGEEKINNIISGNAKPEVYQAIPGDIARLQLGTSTLPAERSIWHNWRHASTVIAFDRFGATTYRYYNQVLRSIYQQKNGQPFSKYQGWRRLLDNLYTLTTSIGPGENHSSAMTTLALTAPAAGLAMLGIRQLVSYGKDSIPFIDWDDKEENNVKEYIKLYADCYISSTMSGPLANLYTDWRKGNLDPARFGTSAILPVNAMMEIIDFTCGNGQYKNKDNGEKVQTFIQSSYPASPAIATWLSIVAHGPKDAEFLAAKKNFYAWKTKHIPGSGAKFFGGGEDEEVENYHEAINHAYTHILEQEKAYNQSGDQVIWQKGSKEYKSIIRLVEEALNTSYKKNQNETEDEMRKRVANSFLSKRLLKKLNKEDRARFYAQGNEKVIKKLEEHDGVLEWIADKIEGN